MEILARLVRQNGPRTTRELQFVQALNRKGINQHDMMKVLKNVSFHDMISDPKNIAKYDKYNRKLAKVWNALARVPDIPLPFPKEDLAVPITTEKELEGHRVLAINPMQRHVELKTSKDKDAPQQHVIQ